MGLYKHTILLDSDEKQFYNVDTRCSFNAGTPVPSVGPGSLK